MNNQICTSNEQLENAFELFNRFSEKLAGSYGDLESHVARLTTELAEARSQRLIQLAEKEELANRLEGLLDALPAGIVVLDANDCITQTNPVARQMLAYQSGSDLLIAKDWKSIAQKHIKTEGGELRLSDGRWVNLLARPLSVDNAGTNRGKIILISDITETRNLQIKLNRQQRLSSLGEMIASLAHQIRTPLASAMLYISTLNHPLNDEKERIHSAKKAQDRLFHLERMVNDMLIFAKGDAAETEYIDAAKLMKQFKYTVEYSDRVDKIHFDINSNLEKVLLQVNRDVLLSAFQNIIDNAIDACIEAEKSEHISIQVSALLNAKNQFEISIKDNGCGMSEAVKEKVLEPFFTTRTSGTGLGLAVVSAVVNRYAGELHIDSEPGAGSVFTIKFLRAEVAGMLPSSLNRVDRYPVKQPAHSINNAAPASNLMNKRFNTIYDQGVAL